MPGCTVFRNYHLNCITFDVYWHSNTRHFVISTIFKYGARKTYVLENPSLPSPDHLQSLLNPQLAPLWRLPKRHSVSPGASTCHQNTPLPSLPKNVNRPNTRLIDILGTKVDIVPSQFRTFVAVADIFQNGRLQLIKTF